MICTKSNLIAFHTHLVGVFFSCQGSCCKAVTNFYTFDGIDAHQSACKFGIELAVDRGAETCGNTACHQFDDSTTTGTGLPDAVEIGFPLFGGNRIRAPEWIALNLCPVPAASVNLERPHLNKCTTHLHTGQHFACQSTGCDTCSGLACGLAAAPAIITNAVLGFIGIVGMSRAKRVLDVPIIFRPLIGVFDHQGKGGSCRDFLTVRIGEST